MAAIETTRVAPFGAVAILRVIEFFERIDRAIREKFIADETYRELSALSPRQLRDIGLADHDLDAYCRDAARRAR